MTDTSLQTLLLGELSGRRRIENREALAEMLKLSIGQLNSRFKSAFVAPLSRTRGVQGLSCVLSAPTHAFDIVASVNRSVWPASYRFSLAAGEIEIGLESGDVSQMDGPAFDFAQAELERAHSKEMPLALGLGLDNQAICSLIECSAHLHGIIVSGWSPAKAEVARCFCEEKTQTIIAERLDISQQAVSQSLLKSRIKDLIWIEDSIRQGLCSLTGASSSV